MSGIVPLESCQLLQLCQLQEQPHLFICGNSHLQVLQPCQLQNPTQLICRAISTLQVQRVQAAQPLQPSQPHNDMLQALHLK